MRSVLLQKLPPFSKRYRTISKNQNVGDIVEEVLQAHQVFAPDYDAIANEFDSGNNVATAKNLFSFLKKNVAYKIESEAKQTTKSPAAILETVTGDCKHYSGFIAGVLDALKRQGRSVDWFYRFASYNMFDDQPGHVFVVVKEDGKEYWIDPVLKSFNERLEPTYILDKKPKQMLQRVSGIDYTERDNTGEVILLNPGISDDELYEMAMAEGDPEISPEMTRAIATLYKYGVMDGEGRVNDGSLEYLSNTLAINEFEEVAAARIAIHTAAIGGFFKNVWQGIKKVTGVVPRNAYLALVGINGFGYARKLYEAITNKDGSFNAAREAKLKSKWTSLGGDYNKLKNTILDGKDKKAILGAAPAAAAPAWALAAAAIIAAMAPIISGLLSEKASEVSNAYPHGICDDGFTPRNADGSCPAIPGSNKPGSDGGGSGLMEFIQNNTLIVAAGAAAALYFFTKK